MADMTPLSDILNGDAATATTVQNNFQTIETYINGANLIRADGTEVMAASLDMDSNKIVNLADATASGDAIHAGQVEVGAWTTWATTWTQSSAVTHTVNYSKYTRIGRTITWNFNLTASGSGASTTMTVSPPVAPANYVGIIGSATFYDSSAAQRYTLTAVGTSATTIAFAADVVSSGFLGGAPSVAIAANDQLRGSVTYEAAS